MFEFIIYCIGFLVVLGCGLASSEDVKKDNNTIFFTSLFWPVFLPIIIGAALAGLASLGEK